MNQKLIAITFFFLFVCSCQKQGESFLLLLNGTEYDDIPNDLGQKLGFELLANSTHPSALQGGAAFGNYYFQFHGQNNKNGQGVASLFYGVEVFNLLTKTKVQEITLGFDCLKHNNSASFGNQYYDTSDVFPLLYVSQEHASARYVTVYRIQGEEGSFTLTMVQVIYLPAINEGAKFTYPNCFVDLSSRRIVFSGSTVNDVSKYTFEEWALPVFNSGISIPLGRIQMTDGGDGNMIEVEGFTLPNGNVVRRNDNDVATEIKAVLLEADDAVKSFQIPSINPYTGLFATAQGGCMYNGKVYQSFGSVDNAVLKVIDINNGDVFFTLDLTKMENAEPEAVFIYSNTIGFACNGTGKIKLLHYCNQTVY